MQKNTMWRKKQVFKKKHKNIQVIDAKSPPNDLKFFETGLWCDAYMGPPPWSLEIHPMVFQTILGLQFQMM